MRTPDPHRAFSVRGEGQDTAVVLLHGFMGSPAMFRAWTAALSKSCDVYAPLLPGHGGDGAAFSASGMALWQRCADELFTRLRRRYRRVYAVGHSMGCLLALDYARRHPGGLSGLLLLAPALSLRPKKEYYETLKKMAFGGDCAAARACGVRLQTPGQVLAALPRTAELISKGRAVRTEIGAIQTPMLAFFCREDELVSDRYAVLFRQAPHAQVFYLKGCGHFNYPKAVEAQIVGAILSMIDRQPFIGKEGFS